MLADGVGRSPETLIEDSQKRLYHSQKKNRLNDKVGLKPKNKNAIKLSGKKVTKIRKLTGGK